MHHRMNEGCKVLGALQGVMKNRGLGMNVKKVRLLNICFMLSIEPVDWVIACMVPLCQGKIDVNEYSNFRGISLLSMV